MHVVKNWLESKGFYNTGGHIFEKGKGLEKVVITLLSGKSIVHRFGKRKVLVNTDDLGYYLEVEGVVK